MIYTIYGIHHIDSEDDILYIGSTNNLNNRISLHKNNSKNENCKLYNSSLYKFVRTYDNKWDDFIFKTLETLECVRKKDALDREKVYILQFKTNEKHNKQIPTNFINIGRKEYNAKWNSENKEYFKNYYLNKVKEMIFHCPYCDYMCNISHKARHEKTKKHINNKNIRNIDIILEKI